MKIFIRWKIFLFILPTFLVLLLIHKIVFPKQSHKCIIPHALNDLCNDPLQPAKGLEGSVSPSEYRLESLHIITRHGDRSALHILEPKQQPTSPFKCFFSEELVRGIPILHDFIESMNHQASALSSPSFLPYSKMPLLPSLMHCPTGSLTPQGAAQQLRNGLFLQGAYKKHNIFGHSIDLRVRTTGIERTFQTAVAFLYGFLPHFNFSSTPFEMASGPTMCTKRSPLKCDCPALLGTEQTLSCTYRQSWAQQMQPETPAYGLRARVSKSFVFDSNKSFPSPSPVFDFLVSHHCHQQHMVDTCILSDVFTHVNNHGKRMEKHPLYVDMSRLKVLPLLAEINSAMMKLSKKKARKPVVRLFSGHDTTIAPLLAAMGVGEGSWPKYAARLVLEQYSHRTSGRHYLRVLHDGVPVTKHFNACYDDVRFIDMHSLCPIGRLSSFVADLAKKYRANCYRNNSPKIVVKSVS